MSGQPQSGDLVSFVDEYTKRRVFGHIATPPRVGNHFRVRTSGSGYASKVVEVPPGKLTVERG